MMKKINLLLLLAVTFVFLPGCKDNRIKSSELLRKIQLRNTPDDIAADLITALQKGKAKQIYTLSTDRVQNIMENSYLFTDQEMEFNDIIKRWNQYLQKQYSPYLLSGKLLKQEEKVCIYQLIMQTPDSEEYKTLEIKLILDKHKNWKNDTRF